MDFTRLGVILNTENYAACVAFYRDILRLPVMFEKDTPEEQLTCFDYGGAYLMVEPGGVASAATKAVDRCPTKFRFNTDDIAAACARLAAQGVEVDFRSYAWGGVAEFRDPDGNRCALRCEAGFGA